MHTMVMAKSSDAAYAAGAVTFYVVFLALGIGLVVAGSHQLKATQGRQGKLKKVLGGLVLGMLVLGILGQIGQQN